MSLDVNTPLGQQTLRDEGFAADLFERHYKARYLHTPKDRASRLDAFVLKGNTLCAVALTSCRYNVTLATFHSTFDCEMLLTWRKVQVGAWLSRGLQVPLLGLLYFVPDRVLMVAKLYDLDHWAVPFRRALTETQATVNGGRALRMNVFIDMSRATQIAG